MPIKQLYSFVSSDYRTPKFQQKIQSFVVVPLIARVRPILIVSCFELGFFLVVEMLLVFPVQLFVVAVRGTV
jgi:hypothetical protein